MSRTLPDTHPGASPRGRLWPALADYFSPHLLVMGAVFIGAVLVGYLLLPDANERIAMLERDGHDDQALEILQSRYASGDRSQRTLFQLQSLYEERGDIGRAQTMLELLAQARPRDANVQRHLAEFYRSTQNEAGYIRVLERRLAMRFSQPVCKELIGLHRRVGNYEAEQRMIASCHALGYRRPDDLIRLAHLEAADGRLAEAAALLQSVDDRRRLQSDEDRMMLVAALLEANGAEEAKRRASRWSKGSRDDALLLQIIDKLAESRRHDLAIDLARDIGRPGDSVSLAVGELMLDQDQIVAARTYLRGWLEATKLTDPETAARIVRAALEAEDPLLAYRAAELFGLKSLSQDDLVALAEALSALEQTEAFQAVKARIAPENLQGNPLLAAAIEVDQGKPEPARQLLSTIEVKALDEWRLALWARLMNSTGRRATAEQTLREIAAGVAGAERPLSVTPLPGNGGVAGGPTDDASATAPAPVTRPLATGPQAAAPIVKKSRAQAGKTRPARRSRLRRTRPAVPRAPPKAAAETPFQFPFPKPN